MSATCWAPGSTKALRSTDRWFASRALGRGFFLPTLWPSRHAIPSEVSARPFIKPGRASAARTRVLIPSPARSAGLPRPFNNKSVRVFCMNDVDPAGNRGSNRKTAALSEDAAGERSTRIADIRCRRRAPFVCRIVRLFPPLVAGTVITDIDLSLFPVAVNWALGGEERQALTGSQP